MADEYNPSATDQHAQLLFDNWEEGELGDLYSWLSNRNIDANVTPHTQIKELYIADHTEGDE